MALILPYFEVGMIKLRFLPIVSCDCPLLEKRQIFHILFLLPFEKTSGYISTDGSTCVTKCTSNFILLFFDLETT